MYGVDKHFCVVRVDVKGNSVAQIEHVSRTLTVASEDIRNFSTDALRASV